MSKEMTPREIWDNLTVLHQRYLKHLCESRVRASNIKRDTIYRILAVKKLVKEGYPTELGRQVCEAGSGLLPLPESELDTWKRRAEDAERKLAAILQKCVDASLMSSGTAYIEAVGEIEAIVRQTHQPARGE